MNQHGRIRAFTLVELLVVIGIIAVLIAILMPALTAAREQARLTQCSNNMRQVYQVFCMYNTEYDGYYPAIWGYHGWTGQVNADFDQIGDCVEVMQHYEQGAGGYTNPTKQLIWICPSDQITVDQPGTGDLRSVSYLPNAMAWEGARPLDPSGVSYPTDNDPAYCRAIKPIRIHWNYGNGLSDVIMLAESYYEGGGPECFYQGASPKEYGFFPWANGFVGRRTNIWYDGNDDDLCFRHGSDYSKANDLYFDGHVQSMDYREVAGTLNSMLTWPDGYSH